ncbi:MAG: pseudaminic acid synthase [Magnetococcales bacterium]|nr:pseudaminic acid synthase [Magnetococcales bacterium]
MKQIQIGKHLIGPGHAPWIIAEMSGNHNQSLDRALAIVDAAAEAGVHALKLQTYTAETMTLDLNEGDFFIESEDSLWKGKSLYQLYEQAHTPWEWHEPLLNRCKEHGIIGFSTPFDATAVDFLEKLNVPLYKIASFENTDLPLIRKVAATGKPLIISTGMATAGELEEAVKTAREAGCDDIILLKCTSAYPAPAEQANLKTIPQLAQLFHCQSGLSDHTLGIGVAVAATVLGATVIEKHFCLDRQEGGVDSAFSMEPAEMAQLVVETGRAAQALGTVHLGPVDQESDSWRFRRSLYIAEDMVAGEIFTDKNLRAIRPGYGLPPRYYDLFIGRPVGQSVKKGTPLSIDLLGAKTLGDTP